MPVAGADPDNIWTIGSSRMRFDRPANGMVKVSWLTDTGCLPVAGTDLDSIWIIGWTIVK